MNIDSPFGKNWQYLMRWATIRFAFYIGVALIVGQIFFGIAGFGHGGEWTLSALGAELFGAAWLIDHRRKSTAAALNAEQQADDKQELRAEALGTPKSSPKTTVAFNAEPTGIKVTRDDADHRIVLWIDEDERVWAPERRLLSALSYSVIGVGDATHAYSLISTLNIDQIDLIIIDVMLLAGSDKRFSEDEFNVGISLATYLLQDFPSARKKILLFSRASNPSHVDFIKRRAAELGIKYMRKDLHAQGMGFIDALTREFDISSHGEGQFKFGTPSRPTTERNS